MTSRAIGLVILLPAFGVALAAPAGGCGGSSSTVAPDQADASTPRVGGDLPCDVDEVLRTSCQSCHGAEPSFGAPMPLVTRADLLAPSPSDPSRKVYELASEYVSAGRMPPPPNPAVSTSGRDTLAAWAAAGAPEGSGPCAVDAAAPGPVDPTVGCTPDLTIAPASAWEMPRESGDEYVCYGVSVSRDQQAHVTAFAPRVDNTRIVHHIVLFEADAAYSTTPTRCPGGGSLGWRMVMAWAPGGKGLALPPDVGFPIGGPGETTHYVVQMHYSNPSALTGEKDASGFDLCTTSPRRRYDADVLAFGTHEISMPAQPPAYERTCSITVPNAGSALPIKFAGIHLIAAMPHMHQLGREMSTTLTRAGADPIDLGTIGSWRFENQPWLPIGSTPDGVVVQENDVITTRCAWLNTTGSSVGFGEDTADEMCYSFTMYYPKISAAAWSWAAPAYLSQCQ